MDRKILKTNELAFKNRYGESLQEKWGGLSRDEKLKALDTIEHYDADMESVLNFDKDIILRVLLGFGNRSCIEKVLDNSISTLKAVVWEPDTSLFAAYCTKEDISGQIGDDRLEIVIGNDIGHLESVFRDNVHDNNAFHSKVMAVGQYANRNNQYVSTLVSILEKIADDVTQDGYARKVFHVLPCNNLLYTINSLSDNYIVSQLFDAITDRDIPIIIVSAGPSLSQNYAELKRAKNRAVIIAVAHAMKTLYNGNIIPDLVAITDASCVDFLDFDNEKKYTLLSSIFADKGSREGYDGQIIYHGFNMINHLFECERTREEPYSELDTGSVSTDVFSLFLSAGFKHIILVGQDLAYGDDGFTHAGGEKDVEYKENDPAYSMVDGIYGGKVRTRWDWERFRRFFEEHIESNKDVSVIDATEGGALIKGTKIMSLSDAIDKYCKEEFPVDEWIKSLEKGSEKERVYIIQWLEDGKNDIDSLSKYIDEAIRISDSVSEKWNDPDAWNNEFRALCKRYDVLFGQIMEGDRGGLLRLYCVEQIQKYVENALIYEGDENALGRIRMERDLLIEMKEKAGELLDYMRGMK